MNLSKRLDKNFQFFIIFLFFNEFFNKIFTLLNLNISFLRINQILNLVVFFILITNYIAGKNQFLNLRFYRLIYWLILLFVPLSL